MATIHELEEKYDADNDIMPGLPDVTWCDYQLLQLIKKLEKRVAALEADKPSPKFQEYREKRYRWAKQCEESMRLQEG